MKKIGKTITTIILCVFVVDFQVLLFIPSLLPLLFQFIGVILPVLLFICGGVAVGGAIEKWKNKGE